MPRRARWEQRARENELHGGDPTGAASLTRSAIRRQIVEEKVDIGYSSAFAPGASAQRGSRENSLESEMWPAATRRSGLCAAVAPKEFDLDINLNLGAARGNLCRDLTEEYVDFNKGDVAIQVTRWLIDTVNSSNKDDIAISNWMPLMANWKLFCADTRG